MKRIIALAVAVAISSPAFAGASFFSADMLYKRCTGDDVQQVSCHAYIVGALDMGNNALFCIPDNLKPRPFVEAFIKAARENESLRSLPADVFLVRLIAPTFPCKERENPAATEPRRNPRGGNWS
jgi:hypothetical protein